MYIHAFSMHDTCKIPGCKIRSMLISCIVDVHDCMLMSSFSRGIAKVSVPDFLPDLKMGFPGTTKPSKMQLLDLITKNVTFPNETTIFANFYFFRFKRNFDVPESYDFSNMFFVHMYAKPSKNCFALISEYF